MEIDGEQHGFEDRRRRDALRDKKLAASGFLMLRFWNHEVPRNRDGVVEAVLARAQTRPGEPVTIHTSGSSSG